MSQPAASHALQRLRKSLGDPLFVRTSKGLQPTPYALGISERVHEALRLVGICLETRTPFAPQTTTRSFSLFITDIGDIVLLPPLLAYFRQHAPNARIRTLGSGYKDIGKQLESGNVDLTVTVLPRLSAGFYQQTLFREQYVCIVRADHPTLADKISWNSSPRPRMHSSRPKARGMK